jgi:hypothetical protein
VQDTVEKLKAKLIEAAGVYRKDKEVGDLRVGKLMTDARLACDAGS